MPTKKPSVSDVKAPTLIGERNDLLRDAKANEEERNYVAKSRRERREENNKHIAFVVLLWLTVGLFSIGLISKVSQFLLPERWEWLTDKQRVQLNDFLTTGILSGGVVGLLKNKLSRKVEE